jgi:hypothetical protein
MKSLTAVLAQILLTVTIGINAKPVLAQSSFIFDPPAGWYFVAEVESDDNCEIVAYFMIAPYFAFGNLNGPAITAYEAKGDIVFRDGKKKALTGFASNLSRGNLSIGKLSVSCATFDHIEITSATCSVSVLGQFGNVRDAEVLTNDECLGPMPRSVYPAGRFTPDKKSLLLPLAPPLPDDGD